MTVTLIGATGSGDVYFSIDDTNVVRRHDRVAPGEPQVISQKAAEQALYDSQSPIIFETFDDFIALEEWVDRIVPRWAVDVDQLPIGPATATRAPAILRSWLDDPERSPAIPDLIARLLAMPLIANNPTLVVSLSKVLAECSPTPQRTAHGQPTERLSTMLSFFSMDAAA